jgi:hypothetical protein
VKALPQGTTSGRDRSRTSGDATFLENAAGIFEVAEQAGRDPNASDWSILVGAEGAIHMIAASDWPLDSLQAHHGAQMAYRVSQHAGSVRLEGRAGARTCLFEAAKPDGAARLLLANSCFYRVIPAAATPSPLPANTWPLLPAA